MSEQTGTPRSSTDEVLLDELLEDSTPSPALPPSPPPEAERPRKRTATGMPPPPSPRARTAPPSVPPPLPAQPPPPPAEALRDAVPRRGGATPETAPSGEEPTLLKDREAFERLESMAHELVATLRRRLAEEDLPKEHAARLQGEVGRLLAFPLGEPRRAISMYREALSSAPDHLPIVRELRRVLSSRGTLEEAASLLEVEARLHASSSRRAWLSYLQGCLLEEQGGSDAEARACFAVAWELGKERLAPLMALEASQYREGRWDALDRTWERSVNAVPDDDDWRAAVLADRGWIAALQGREAAGVEHYLGALRLVPSDARAAVAVEASLGGQGRWRELAAHVVAWAERVRDPHQRALRLFEGAQLFASSRIGDEEEAVRLLEQAWSLAPEEPLVIDALSDLYERRGRFDALVRVLERRARLAVSESEGAALWLRLGELLLEELGRAEEAEAAFGEALRLDPVSRAAADRQVGLLEEREAWEEAAAVAVRIAEEGCGREDAALWRLRAARLLAERLGRDEAAVEQVLAVLHVEPRHDEALRMAAHLLGRAERWRDLLACYERAMDRALDDAERFALAMRIAVLLEEQLQAPREAAEAYRRAASFELRGGAVAALRAWQRAAARSGDREALREALRAELSADPPEARRVEILLEIAGSYAEVSGEEGNAVAVLRDLLRIRPDDERGLEMLASLHARRGRWDELLDVLQRRLQACENSRIRAEVSMRMGEVAEHRLGREADAAERYREVLEAWPGHVVARRALRRLWRRMGEWDRLAEMTRAEVERARDGAARARAAYRLGLLLEEQGEARAEEALGAHRTALQADPSLLPAWRAAWRLALALARWEELASLLEEAEPHLTDPLERIGVRLWRADLWADRLGRRRAALALLSEETTRQEGGVGMAALRRRIRWALAERRGVEAATALRELAAATASNAVARGAGAQALRVLGRKAPPSARAEVALELLRRVPGDLVGLEALETAAMEMRDLELLLRAETMASEAIEEPTLRAHHVVRRAEVLEALERPDALEAFEEALRIDPGNVAASRGLARLAERLGEPRALAEAIRREAEMTGASVAAASLLVRSATLRAERLRDETGAIEDLERALQMDPESEAVDALEGLLRRRGEHERLAAVLARVAERAERPARKADLYRRLARLQAGDLDRLGAAIGSLTRALKVKDDDVRALLELAALYERDRQWQEAIRLLDRVVKRGTEREDIFEAHLRLARLWSEHGGDPHRALVSLQAVLALERGHREAWLRLASLHEREGRLPEAMQAAERLLEVSEPGAELLEALLLRARLLDDLGRSEESLEDLLRAVTWEGPGGEAAALARSRLQGAEAWRRFLDALVAHGERAGRSVALELAIASAWIDGMGEVERGLAQLRDAVSRQDHPRLRRELASRLQQAGHHDEAEQAWLELLEAHPLDLEARRALGRLYEALQRPAAARYVFETLMLLGGRIDEEAGRTLGASGGGGSWRQGALDRDALLMLCGLSRSERRALDLLFAMRPALAKLHPPDLDAYGLAPRDRLTARSGDATRALADRCAALFGGVDFELFVHGLARREVALEPSVPPSLLVPSEELERPMPGKIVLLLEPLVLVALGLEGLAKLTPREVQILVAAAVRPVRENFGSGLTAEEELISLSKRLYKALPWLGRKPVQEAALAYAEVASKVDFGRLVYKCRRAALFVAALAADDLGAALAHLRRTHPDLADLDGPQMLERSEMVRDLFAFWTSPGAGALRRRMGVS